MLPEANIEMTGAKPDESVHVDAVQLPIVPLSRSSSNKISDNEAQLFLFKSNVGIAVISLSYCFMKAGYLSGIITMLVCL